MKENQPTPTAMIPVKELGLHAKVQSLQSMFVTLAASLNPPIAYGPNGPEKIDAPMNAGVRTSIETALIQTCNRICAFMGDERNWAGDENAQEILGMLMGQAVADMKAEQLKPKRPRKKKGPESDEQK